MKKIFNYMMAGLLGCALLTGCADDALETSPTDSMSSEGIMNNVNTAIVPLEGIYRSMYTSGWSTSGNTHQCFGISAYVLMADVMGEDMIMSAMGSGWFWYDCLYQVKDMYASQAWRPYDMWNAFYTWISNANAIIAADGTMEGDAAEVNYILGQAYAIRAYSYFMLAQNFARTYKGHESEPCCPIYTEATQIGTQGKGRSTVQEVYDQINSDLTRAIELLGTASARSAITHIDVSVAYGIQARVALTMEEWNAAYTAATNAIQTSGCQICPVSDFAGLNDTDAANVMWGASIKSDQSGMYASLFSHMDADPTVSAYGYTARKQINKELYAMMGANDERRSWWNPEDANNGSNGGYQQEKFKFSNATTWEGDYIWMRVEEMYLTAAEAACMLGEEATAQELLGALMEQRDPDYDVTILTGTAMGTTSSQTTSSLREAIVNQRRIELWGEYGRIWDLRRLHQGFERTTDMGWPFDAQLDGRNNTNPESYMWVMTIPQSEFDGNANMNQATDQNPVGDTAN